MDSRFEKVNAEISFLKERTKKNFTDLNNETER
jgi:hypothetical protein